MKQRSRLPGRSQRKIAEDAEYGLARAAYLRIHSRCQIRWDRDCRGEATEVHHRINRSQRRDLIADPANFCAACRSCHALAGSHVYEAQDRGISGQSWQNPTDLPPL